MWVILSTEYYKCYYTIKVSPGGFSQRSVSKMYGPRPGIELLDDSLHQTWQKLAVGSGDVDILYLQEPR